MNASRTYTFLDFRRDLAWLEDRLDQLPDDDFQRVGAIKQVRAAAEQAPDASLEMYQPDVEDLYKRERKAAARSELSFLLQALGKKPPAHPEVLAKVNRRSLRRFLKTVGSHSVYKPEALTALGLPEDFVAAITYEHGGIFLNDGTYGSAVGVSVLDFVRHLADALGVDSRTGYMGRGRQVDELRERLLAALSRRKCST